MTNPIKPWVGRGSSVDEAVQKGLRKFSLTRDRVDVEILDERESGLLSMMGFRSVKVRVTPKPGALPAPRPARREDFRPSQRPQKEGRQAPQQAPGRREERFRPDRERSGRPQRQGPPSRERDQDRDRSFRDRRERPAPPRARHDQRSSPPSVQPSEPIVAERRQGPSYTPETLLAEWKRLTGWDDLEWTFATEGQETMVTLKTSHGERLAGPSAAGVLEAWEYIFNSVLSVSNKDAAGVRFRVEGFEDPTLLRIADIAREAAAEAKRSGRMYRLDPMSSAERKLVHQTLKDDPDVETFSEGEGPWRKVVVRPKPKPGTAAGGRGPVIKPKWEVRDRRDDY